ncbi:RE2 [Symbiodinium sp. CCMP2592]|nr:RE2 [Symbiodinium sp. CCMP2592]
MAGAPESVHQPAAGASQVDDLLEGVHRPSNACAGGSPPSGVECRLQSGVDREDHHMHNVGSHSAISRPSPGVVEAARSRSPRPRDGAQSQRGSSHDEGHVSAADVLRVFDGLPSDALKRGADAPLPTSKSYATGAYVLGGNVGLKANASANPEALKVFARFVRQRAPGFKFSSINIFEDVRTERHRDQWNANLHNLAIALTDFSGGAIFVEHENGRDVSDLNGARGSRLQVAKGPVRFNARHNWHYTEAWQGRRVLLVAFTIRHVESLCKEHLDFLRECHVDVPKCAPEGARLAPAEACARQPPSLTSPVAQESLRPLPASVVPAVDPKEPVSDPASPLKPGSALYVEIKCGSGLLPARVRRDGFQIIALEHSRPAGRVHTHLVPVDIETESGFSFVQTVISHDAPFHVHFFPATKDCFKATFCAGQTIRIAKLLLASDSHWSVLHPLASVLWKQLDLPDNLHCVDFCAGCYGAPSPVKMRLCTTQAALAGMPVPACRCRPGPHAAGSLSPDALYTSKFCDVFAGLLQLAVGQSGLLLEHALPLQSSRHSAVAAAGRQPRLSKFQPQIAEFKCQATVREFPWPLPLDNKGNLTCAVGSIPPGSRLLRVVCDRGVVGAKQVGSLSGVPSAVTFGIYRTEQEFVAQALHIDHPFDLCVAVPDFMLRALAFTLKEGPVGVMKHRLNLLQQWTSWKRDLAGAEAELHAAMDPGVASVMKGKNILLLEKIASSFGWPDTEVFEHLKHGFPLVGESSPSGIFDVDRKPALMTRAELVQHAKFLRPALWAKVANAEVDDLAREVWDSTQQEMLVKEWLTGPYSWDELQARHPEGWLPVRRFGIVQKAKTRSIDDLAENSVNCAYAVSDRISLRALDELVWLAITLFKIFLAKGEVSIPLSDGDHLRFPVHSFWRALKPEALQPSLKTVDLKSAYKQLAVSPRDRCLSIVAIKDPVSGLAFGFESRTLLFGATSSVVSFNRVARLLQRVLVALQVLACNYFDDYPVLEVLPLCNNTQSTIRAVLDLLGFTWAEDKDLPFSHEAELLGVRVDLGCFGVVKIGNKPERATSIADAVDSVLKAGHLDPKTLPSLFGRLQFAEGQLHGRLGRLALADLRACTMSSQAKTLDATAVQALCNLRSRVLGGTPRIVPACVGSRRSVIFTDGAYEPTSETHPATVGGVLYHFDNGAWCTFFFACAIPLSVVQSWEALGKRHLIGPVEMYAVVCAREAWAKHLDMQRVTMYVDHSGVLASLVKGSSKDPLWRQLLLIFESCDAEAMLPWFSRVPSASNPADPPSRAKSIFPVRGQGWDGWVAAPWPKGRKILSLPPLPGCSLAILVFAIDRCGDDQVGDSELLPALCRPRTSDLEPELSPEELEALDVIADGVEIARLEGMSVLLPETAVHSKEYEGQEPTKLTTRMVRTWREKQIGDTPVWYRRSRYVAREYAWLSERHDLFSPASTALSNRLLPIHFLCHEPDHDDPWVMVALDISDAYLSVKQTRLVIVQHAGTNYVLGRVLPGQRDGSKEWYVAFSTFLDEALGFKKCDALPSLIREPASKFSMQMHVDDLLGAGSKRFLEEKLKPTLESKYRVSVHILEKPGDTISFLKRHHTLVAEGKMLLTPSAKHFEKLFSVMKIDERSAPKKTPYASLLDEVDHSETLPPADAKAFRCAIGILLYLAVDLIECQGAIRALSSYMTSPTRNAQIALRQLLKYLLEGQHHGLLLDRKHCCGGVSREIPSTSQGVLCLESFSDANWASSKGSRKSVSSGMVFVGGCLLYSSSRTQRVIALSSGEAELLAATSTLCDALFVRQLLAFIADVDPPQVHHFLDATAAKSIMERSGVGRVRHLSVRVLWSQQLVAEQVIALHKVGTSVNVADLNTKGLSRSRMLLLLNLLGCWHTLHERFVGEDEIAELHYKQAMKDAVRAVRASSTGAVSKPMIQAIVIAVVSALSRAADVSEGDDSLADQDDGLPDWANRVLVWFLGLWVRDDTGVSVIDMLVQPHALVLACVTMLMLVLCIRTLCCRVSDRGQVNVQIAGPRDHVSFQFDRQLNLHVGVGAPGTPTNPLSFDFDGDDSPPHVLSALRKGARSKASTRPGPRYEDEDAPHPDASSSAAPPTGAMNAVQAHVPPADHASAPGTPAESMSSQLSTQSFRELHGYPIAVARRMNHRGGLVWVSHTGRCYHRLRCFKLDGCDRVKAYERHEAQNRGLRACKKCNP